MLLEALSIDVALLEHIGMGEFGLAYCYSSSKPRTALIPFSVFLGTKAQSSTYIHGSLR